MDEPMNPLLASWTKSRRTVFHTLVWGFGFGVGIGIILLAVMLCLERPKGWDTKSLRVMNVKAEALGKLDEHLVTTSTGNIFTVDVENTTGKDLSLPASVTIMQAAKGTGALHGSLLKLSQDYFLPAHHTVSVTLENDGECSTTVKDEDCFNSYFKDESYIVLFDRNQKYEIRIPIPALTRTPDFIQMNPPVKDN